MNFSAGSSRSLARSILVAGAVVLCLGLTGCGLFNTYAGDCTRQSAVGAGDSTGSANYAITPVGSGSVTMYPGQTLTVPFTVVAKNGSTGAINIGFDGLPLGMTAAPVTAQIGSTANITFVSTPKLGSECFEAITQIYSSHATVAVEAKGTGGSTAYGLDLEMVLDNPSFKPAKTDLPTLDLETDDAAPIVSEDDYINGTLTIVDPNNKKNDYTGTLEVKGHGNTTWIMPKKPYRIKLDSKSGLLGMPSEKNWILLANYDDKTMLRDALASEISNITGLPWAPRSVFVEMTLNGTYQGTYQLIENVDINGNRMNITDSDEDVVDDTTPDAYGFRLEIDQREDNTYHWLTPHGIDISTDDPNPPSDQISEVYIHDRLNAAEASLYSSNFTDPTAGWRAYWDQDSVVDWFIVNELMGNQDADAFSSDYLYKDAGDVPFVMGPIWDFDVSSGNVNYSPIQYPTVPWIRTQHPWYAQLFNDPTFVAAVKARWAAIRPQIDTLPAYINTNAATLQLAASNNYSRWPTLYQRVWPNPQAAGTYSGEITYLQTWLAARVAYMDSNYLK